MRVTIDRGLPLAEWLNAVLDRQSCVEPGS